MRAREQAGFTLLEAVASIAVLGFLAIFVGSILAMGARGAMTAQQAHEMGQKAQIALTRIAEELRDANGGPASGGTAIRIAAASVAYTSSNALLPGTVAQPRILAYDAGSGRITLTVAGSAYTLLDNVASCAMSADSTYAPTITVRFTLSGSGGSFAITVTPRGNLNPPANS